MKFSDWKKNPPKGRSNNRIAWVSVPPADFVLLQREAALQGMPLQKFTAMLIEPELQKLREQE